MPRTIILLAVLLFAPAAFVCADQPQSVEIRLERVEQALWRASYSFSRPVESFRVYPAALAFRERHWRVLSPGISLTETAQGGEFGGDDGVFNKLVVEFHGDSDFGDKTYVPVLPFSGGGGAVYTGHFSGDILVDGSWQTIPTRFTLKGLPGENTLLPSGASEQSPVYAYAGSLSPTEADQVIMVIDPEMPAWLRSTFDRSVPAVTSAFSDKLGHRLENKPFVLIAAGELEAYEGYSVKGGGLDGQFTIMLRGTDLLLPSIERQKMFEKMVAHELVHVWQQSMPGGGFNPDEPWLHEGSADALAVAALAATGLWTGPEVAGFHRQQAETCKASLGESDLPTTARDGNWTAIYACGYLEFTEGVEDPFGLYRRLAEAAHASGEPYSQRLLESIR